MTAATTKRRKLDLRKLMLRSGGHSPDSTFCVMEAVAYVAGEPWSDRPKCVSPAIGAFLRNWNDNLPDKDRQRLKPYIRKVIGTNTGAADEQVRAWLATDWLVRSFTPVWLRRAGLETDAAELEALPELTSAQLATAAMPVIRKAKQQAAAVWDAAWDAAWDAVWAAARAAVWAAARAAVWDAAWDAARAAAWDAARAAAWDAAWDAVWAAAWDAAGAAARAAAWAAAGDAAGAAARDAAWDAARAAAWDALAPTIAELQTSAFDLLNRMVAVGK